jgi:hypothetical protein
VYTDETAEPTLYSWAGIEYASPLESSSNAFVTAFRSVGY